MNSRARHFVTGLAGFALNRLRRFRRSGAHPSREVTPEIDRALRAALRDSTEYLGPIK